MDTNPLHSFGAARVSPSGGAKAGGTGHLPHPMMPTHGFLHSGSPCRRPSHPKYSVVGLSQAISCVDVLLIFMELETEHK